MKSYYDLGFGVVNPATPSHPGRSKNPVIHPMHAAQHGATGATIGTGVAVTGGVVLTGLVRAGIATALVQYMTKEKLTNKKLLTLFGVLSVADVLLSGLGIAAVYGASQAATGGSTGVGQFSDDWRAVRSLNGGGRIGQFARDWQRERTLKGLVEYPRGLGGS
tara:strand:- start:724 stop:1212 length:489 start_codon:yes stop_codon:yes gene_type:complete